jgi:thymidylate synthase (FAD)
MKAELITHMGDDLLVVNAARVSFDKESEGFSSFDGKLLAYLAKHNHWTPFSHPQITMRETVPIFVARQRFKHMVGFTYNEVSRRYVDDEPEFFIPDVWRSRPEGSVKQGSGAATVEGWEGSYQEYCQRSLQYYQDMLADGVAPEQARMVLPQSMYTSYYVTGSLAAWARAYKQRIDAHAQKEIQDLAKQWDEVIKPLFPESWAVLTAN